MTDEQIQDLNDWQKNPLFHPLTCGGNRTDEKHLDGEGVLVATKEGWVCPYCDYKQPFTKLSMEKKDGPGFNYKANAMPPQFRQ